jgi:hypothetical protein
MSSSLTRIWKRRIAAYQSGTPIEKSKIGAFRKLIARPRYLPDLPQELTALLGQLYDEYGRSLYAWQVTPEQTEQGLRWLKLPKVKKELTEAQQAILDDFSHFLFVDVQDDSTCYRTHSAPVYRVCAASSPAYFDYVPKPWQSEGLPFEVIGGKYV